MQSKQAMGEQFLELLRLCGPALYPHLAPATRAQLRLVCGAAQRAIDGSVEHLTWRFKLVTVANMGQASFGTPEDWLEQNPALAACHSRWPCVKQLTFKEYDDLPDFPALPAKLEVLELVSGYHNPTLPAMQPLTAVASTLRCLRIKGDVFPQTASAAAGLVTVLTQLTNLQQLHWHIERVNRAHTYHAPGTTQGTIDTADALFTAIPSLPRLSDLEIIGDVGSLDAAAIAGAIGRQPNLHSLVLGSNLSLQAAATLAPVLATLSSMRKLCLANERDDSYLYFMLFEDAVPPRVEPSWQDRAALLTLLWALTKLTNLQELGLRFGSCLDYEGATALACALRKLPHLSHLDLGLNDLGRMADPTAPRSSDGTGSGLGAMSEALGCLSSLQQLRLNGNALGAAVATLPQQLTGLRLLDVSGDMAQGLGKGEELAAALRRLPLLTDLNASKLGLSDACAPTLFRDALATLSGLRRLNLSSNEFGPGSAPDLAFALSRLKRLEELTLAMNRSLFEEGGAGGRLLEAIGQCGGLRELGLGITGLSPDTSTALAQALPLLTCLEVLHLSGNKLEDSCASLLTPPLQLLSALSLRLVSLSQNAWGGRSHCGPAANLPESMELILPLARRSQPPQELE